MLNCCCCCCCCSLVSLWGKMAEKITNRTTTKFVKNWRELKHYLFEGHYCVRDVQITESGGMAIVTYTKDPNECQEGHFSNVAIGALVTAYGRRRIFEMIHRVYGRAFYTDSKYAVCVCGVAGRCAFVFHFQPIPSHI